MATLSETVSDAAGKRLFALAGFIVFLVVVVLLVLPGESRPVEQAPRFEALVMPPGQQPLPLAGISRYTTIDGATYLTVDGMRVVIVGIPVLIFEVPPEPATVAPSLEARR